MTLSLSHFNLNIISINQKKKKKISSHAQIMCDETSLYYL